MGDVAFILRLIMTTPLPTSHLHISQIQEAGVDLFCKHKPLHIAWPSFRLKIFPLLRGLRDKWLSSQFLARGPCISGVVGVGVGVGVALMVGFRRGSGVDEWMGVGGYRELGVVIVCVSSPCRRPFETIARTL